MSTLSYTGTNATLLALTSAELVELEASYPISPANINQDQYNRWLNQSYFLRHVLDDIAENPFE